MLLIMIALTHPYINQQFAQSILSEGKVIKYPRLQEKYPNMSMSQTRPIFIFFHICTKGEHWERILDEQMRCIIVSGLYDRCHTLWYGCSCDRCVSILKNYFKHYTKVKPLSHALCDQVKTYENMTLNSMIHFCREILPVEADCLYIHTKGTTAKSESQHAWREYMMYWLVDQHKMCIDLLQRGFYTVGTIYQKIPLIRVYGYERLYAGNFFWVNSAYMASLPIIKSVGNRFKAEQLIFQRYTRGKHIVINRETYLSLYIPWRTGLYKDSIKVVKKPIDTIDILIV